VPFKPSDIIFVLSGGPDNDSPLASIGGEPSAYPIDLGHQNLFPHVSPLQLKIDHIDYRCIYVFNQNEKETLQDVSIQADSKSEIFCDLGYTLQNDLQRIVVTGTPDGLFSLTNVTNNKSIPIFYLPKALDFLNCINMSINSFSGMKGLVARPGPESKNSISFDVIFDGPERNKYHDTFSVSNNQLQTASVVVQKIINGGPINTVAQLLNSGLEMPDVTWWRSEDKPPKIGSLHPGEGLPIWIRRIIPKGTKKSHNGIVLKVTGNPE
jgi:hypothetical protein